MAKALGLKYGTKVAQMRFKLGFSRHELRKIHIDSEELRKAINEGGETMAGFCRRRGIPLTRERIRQIASDSEIDVKNRTPLWFANKYGHPELGERAVVERLLAEKGRVPAAAAAIGLTERKFSCICRVHNIALPKNRPATMIGLTCSQCGIVFKRPKALVKWLKRRYPERKTCFCTLRCKGKWLGLRRF